MKKSFVVAVMLLSFSTFGKVCMYSCHPIRNITCNASWTVPKNEDCTRVPSDRTQCHYVLTIGGENGTKVTAFAEGDCLGKDLEC